jgi:hypothetical protein
MMELSSKVKLMLWGINRHIPHVSGDEPKLCPRCPSSSLTLDDESGGHTMVTQGNRTQLEALRHSFILSDCTNTYGDQDQYFKRRLNNREPKSGF